ncbi:MAG: hypothetical protein N3B16_08275 [Candidatus Aminicenantes bacterium]|nr:hypothetical protein [Candidatus Aminicenantes bacterium]
MVKNRTKIKLGNFLILLIILMMLSLAQAKASHSEKESQEEFFQNLPLNVQGNFALDNINGLVQIMTWPQPMVEIKAIKKTKKDLKHLKLVRIEIKSTEDRIIVKTVYPRQRNIEVSVDYEIKLPENLAETSLKVINGQIKILGPLSRVKATTVNGSIESQGPIGSADFSAVNGAIEAKITSGPTRIETVNGAINCYLYSLIDNLFLETVNGPIEIKIASEGKLNAYLEAKTTNGAIVVDFPIVFQGMTKEKGYLEGQIGQGGPLMRLRTINGSIRLSR